MADREMSVKLTTEGFTQARVAAKNVEQALSNVGSAVSRMAGSFAQATGLSTLVAGLGSGLGLGALVKSALEASDKMTNMKLGFETILGSKKAADSFVNTLQDMANVTPYNVEPLAEASRVLLAMNFNAKQTEQIIWRLGDAAAAANKGFDFIKDIAYVMGQIKASGVLRTEDFNQIANTGLMGFEQMAQKLGYRTAAEFRKAMENGLVSSSSAINALIDTFETRFQGAMGNMAGTLSGRLSTLGDAWAGALRQIGDALAPGVNKIILGITGAVQGLVDSGWFSKVATAFSAMIDPDKIMQGIAKGMAAIKSVFDNAPAAYKGVIEVMKALPGALIAVFEKAGKRDFWGAIGATIWEGIVKFGLVIQGVAVNFALGLWNIVGRGMAKLISHIPGHGNAVKDFDANFNKVNTAFNDNLVSTWDKVTDFGSKHRNPINESLATDPRIQALSKAGNDVGVAVQKGITDYQKNYDEIYGYMSKAVNNPTAIPAPPAYQPLNNSMDDIVINTAKTAKNTEKMGDSLKKYVMGGGDLGEAGVTPVNMYKDGVARGSVSSAAQAFVETVVMRMQRQARFASG